MLSDKSTVCPINLLDIKFQLSTEGPLKLFRNYQSTIRKVFTQKNEWNYHLIGVDRGVREEKLISYSSTSYPIVHTFIDDDKFSFPDQSVQ